jgi:asparagine synthase (glutamine-hydrolysing)
MLDRIAYRGPAGRCIRTAEPDVVLGVAWTKGQAGAETRLRQARTAQDQAAEGQLAQAEVTADGLVLTRDPLGVAPLYYGWTDNGALCFASEVKAMLDFTDDVHELPPGCRLKGGQVTPYFQLTRQPPMDESPEAIARELRRRLETSVERRIDGGGIGAWLSGGLDSSSMAALARPRVRRLCTFAAGLPGAPDLEYARATADFIQSDHHEVVVNLQDMLRVLPKVIYHLESFDALLVRSSITNYLVARLASDYVPKVFSGEGGDELFAGYEYLKQLASEDLADELMDITDRLHNTALQRVDRCASAHGTVALVGFLDPDVVDYALRIPVELKLHRTRRNGRRHSVEKWILRRVMDGTLPEQVLDRTKTKFWEGAGVGDLLAQHADEHITDGAFARECVLPNGWTLISKEELLYYRIFREHFGTLSNLGWMGRTKPSPR